MFRRPSKKQLLVQRVILYTVMTLSVIAIVSGIVLFILGYRLDSNNGRLAQGALVQFNSTPADADIYIDNDFTGDRTAAKRTVVAGMHQFMVTKEGYHPWQKNLSLNAGTLTWLDYIRLVPRNLPVEAVATYDTVYGEIASPDNRRVLIQPTASKAEFELVDISQPDVRTSTIQVPNSALSSGKKHTYVMKSWDAGGRFVLLHHSYDNKAEWLVVDTQNISRTVNVTRLLSIDFTDIQFAGTSGSSLFGLSGGIVRKLDLTDATISRALISNVTSFDLFETNIISYVGTNSDGTKQVAGVYRDGDAAAHVLRSTEDMSVPLRIDVSRYFSDDYVAIAEGLEVTVLKGRYPSSSQEDISSLTAVATFTVPANVSQLSFSPDGDYVIARSGLDFVSFETEHERVTKATITTSGSRAYTLHWLDDAYLWAIYDGHLSMREYDGTNVHVIMAMEPGFDATLSRDGRYIYGVAKSEDGARYQLQRVTMILN